MKQAEASRQAQESTPGLVTDSHASEIEAYRNSILSGFPRWINFNKDAEIPKRYQGKSLEGYEANKEKVELALKTIRAGGNVYLSGTPGTGKTHLAVALMYEWGKERLEAKYDAGRVVARTREEAIFVPIIDIFMDLKAGFSDNQSERDAIQRFQRRELLVLDDLGAEKPSEWARSVLYYLFDARYRACKATIVTSNFSVQELADRIDDRIASRIIETSTLIELTGDDFRVKINKNRHAKLTATV